MWVPRRPTVVAPGKVGVDGAVEVIVGGAVQRVHVEAFLGYDAVDGVVQVSRVAEEELDVTLVHRQYPRAFDPARR